MPYKDSIAESANENAFTLIELTIVLTVIGLIVGGIMVGSSLIRSAELQSVISDADRFVRAAKLFRDKYKYLPGDFPNAESMWGADTGCGAAAGSGDTDQGPNERKRRTCNGNGDGYIGGYNQAAFPTAGSIGDLAPWNREPQRGWQHLSNAGFIEGSFSGVVKKFYVPGLSVPSSRLSDAGGFNLFYAFPISNANTSPDGVAWDSLFPGTYGHVVEFGIAKNVRVGSPFDGPILTAAEAASIDSKIDDGSPARGQVLTYTPASANSPSCVTTSDPATAAYATTVEGPSCALIFVTGL